MPFYLNEQTMSENNLHLNFSILDSDMNFEPFIPYYGMKKVNVLIKKMGLEFGELVISNRDTIEIEFNPSNGFMIKKKHYGSFEETTYDYNIPKIISTGIDFRNNEETHRVKIELLEDRIRTHTSIKGSTYGGMSMSTKYLFDLYGKVIKKSTQLLNFDERVTDYKYDNDNFIIEQWGKKLDLKVKEQDYINEKSDSILIIHTVENEILNELIIFNNYLLKINKYNKDKMQLSQVIECSYYLNNGKIFNITKLDKHSMSIRKLAGSIRIKTNEKPNLQSLDGLIIETAVRMGGMAFVTINGQTFKEGDLINDALIEKIEDTQITFKVGKTRIIKEVGK